jgi:hypothetical protein
MHRASCQRRGCGRTRSELSLLLSRRRVPQYNGEYYCSAGCLETQAHNEMASRWKRLLQERERRIPRPRLGAILLDTALITPEQLREAMARQRQEGSGRVGEWLIRLGFIEEHQVTVALSRQFGLPLLKLSDSDPKTPVATLIPGKVAKSSHVLAIGYDEQKDTIRMAVSDPASPLLQEGVRRMLNKSVTTYLGDASAIDSLIERWYEPEDIDLSGCGSFASLPELREIVSSVIGASVERRAENLQFELFEGCLWVRMDWAGRSEHMCYRGSVHAPLSAASVLQPRLAYASGSL